MKAANSAIGKQLQQAVATKVDNAIEKAATAGLQKLGFPAPTLELQKVPVESLISTGSKRPLGLQKVPSNVESKRPKNKKLIPPGSKRPISAVGRKKGKRRKIGKGIILE